MLPESVRAELERRMVERAFSGYEDLADWLRQQGYQIAHDGVRRHGTWLKQKIEAMKRFAEDAKAIAAATSEGTYAAVDVTTQLIHQRVFSILLEEPERGEEPGGTAAPVSAPHSHGGGRALAIRDLARLTRIVADLTRASIARQRRAEELKSLREQQQRATGEQDEGGGGLSEEAYNAIRNTLLGIDPFAPDSKRASFGGIRRGAQRTTADAPRRRQAHLNAENLLECAACPGDAQRRASTRRPSSGASRVAPARASRALHTSWTRLVLHFLQLFGHLRHCFEKIGDQAEIRDAENRRLFVLVDCNDRFGILHAGQVLNRTGNPHRHV